MTSWARWRRCWVRGRGGVGRGARELKRSPPPPPPTSTPTPPAALDEGEPDVTHAAAMAAQALAAAAAPSAWLPPALEAGGGGGVLLASCLYGAGARGGGRLSGADAADAARAVAAAALRGADAAQCAALAVRACARPLAVEPAADLWLALLAARGEQGAAAAAALPELAAAAGCTDAASFAEKHALAALDVLAKRANEWTAGGSDPAAATALVAACPPAALDAVAPALVDLLVATARSEVAR